MPLGWQHLDLVLVSGFWDFLGLHHDLTVSRLLIIIPFHSCYKLYFSSYLQVVYNVSVSKAGYIGNIFNIVTCTWAPIVGL